MSSSSTGHDEQHPNGMASPYWNIKANTPYSLLQWGKTMPLVQVLTFDSKTTTVLYEVPSRLVEMSVSICRCFGRSCSFSLTPDQVGSCNCPIPLLICSCLRWSRHRPNLPSYCSLALLVLDYLQGENNLLFPRSHADPECDWLQPFRP